MNKYDKYFFENYKIVLSYLKTLKRPLIFSLCVFLFFAVLGYFFTSAEFAESIMKYFQEIILKTQGYSAIEMVFFIISNNAVATFLSIFIGIVFGIFPIFSAISNGYILGFVSSMSVEKFGFLSLLNLIPHGIFEIPAIFISLAIGLRLGKSSMNLVLFRKKINMKNEIKKAILAYVLVVLPLLAIAGIIEGILISMV